MQERVAQCRRLAISVMDEKAAALRQMADEIETTIARLKAELADGSARFLGGGLGRPTRLQPPRLTPAAVGSYMQHEGKQSI